MILLTARERSAGRRQDMDSTMIFSVQNDLESLPEKISQQLNELILQRDLKAGDKLPNEFELAESLNVGRNTVREAVKILVAKNILEIRRGKGTYVSQRPGEVEDPLGLAYLSDNTLSTVELMEVRKRLEPWIARLAAMRATDREISILREICEELNQSLEENVGISVDLDVRYHKAIAACTHNRIVQKLLPAITYGVFVYSVTTASSGINDNHALLYTSIRTHREIMEGIAAHDPEKAEAAMMEHLQANETKLQLILSQQQGKEISFEEILKGNELLKEE